MAYQYNLKHDQYQSEQYLWPSNLPRLVYEVPHQQPSALPLFLPDNNARVNSLSAFSDSTTTPTSNLKSRVFFSLAQWHELELQALIFKYMLAGASVPAQLIESVKRSLPYNKPACYLHHPLHQHFQPTMLRSGYWGTNPIDPEPGRCRRTDGKKWRCSKDVVPCQKYCDRHMHRGRNRSRKPVETSTQPIANGALRIATSVPTPSPLNIRSYSEVKQEKELLENECNELSSEKEAESAQTLQHFFNDWPRYEQEPNGININADPESSTTCLSISIPGEENPPSDFSLKLSTGYTDGPSSLGGNIAREHNRLNGGAGWGNHRMSSTGGPLAEAFQQSASSSSPTSVLCGEAPR
ncbi:hypothetical protein IFM89_013604 [Coptis chinensis]|uniref:Growth-regulating factor n=1 Tax=Coptis chinensis TaxID=261450 RepID=A0A835HH79_9MAGN|nr:hypothetical protein IFM89_013604 [Coptis chinensis]